MDSRWLVLSKATAPRSSRPLCLPEVGAPAPGPTATQCRSFGSRAEPPGPPVPSPSGTARLGEAIRAPA